LGLNNLKFDQDHRFGVESMFSVFCYTEIQITEVFKASYFSKIIDLLFYGCFRSSLDSFETYKVCLFNFFRCRYCSTWKILMLHLRIIIQSSWIRFKRLLFKLLFFKNRVHKLSFFKNELPLYRQLHRHNTWIWDLCSKVSKSFSYIRCADL